MIQNPVVVICLTEIAVLLFLYSRFAVEELRNRADELSLRRGHLIPLITQLARTTHPALIAHGVFEGPDRIYNDGNLALRVRLDYAGLGTKKMKVTFMVYDPSLLAAYLANLPDLSRVIGVLNDCSQFRPGLEFVPEIILVSEQQEAA